MVLILGIGASAYALHQPLQASRTVLSNGERTIVVQGMYHYGRSSFYRAVEKDLVALKDAGLIWVFEGVIVGSTSERPTLPQATAVSFGPHHAHQPDWHNLINPSEDINLDMLISSAGGSSGRDERPACANYISNLPIFRACYRFSNNFFLVVAPNKKKTEASRSTRISSKISDLQQSAVVHVGESHVGQIISDLSSENGFGVVEVSRRSVI